MRDHKSLLCWQISLDFSKSVHELTVRRWSPPATGAFDQLRRSALSVRLNIVEGYALGSPGGFVRHLNIAYGSATEATELLEFCVEVELLSPLEVGILLSQGSRLQGLILRLKRYCSSKKAK